MRRGKILAVAATVLALLAVFTFAVSADSTQNGWVRLEDGSYEYYENGAKYTDGEYWIDRNWFRFDENGKMYSEKWYQNPDTGDYYYYQAGGYRADGCVVKIGDYYYGFDWDGTMYADTEFNIYSVTAEKSFFYRAEVGGPLVVSRWIYTEDSKYEQGGYYKYYGADGAAYRGIQQVDGVYYHFYDDGQMSTEGSRSIYDGKTESYRDIRAKAGGALFRNEWYQDQWDNWYYYGDDCFAPQGLTTIGSATYYFFWDGRMMTNQTYYDGSCSYYADKNGSAVRLNPNTWTLIGKDYYYCIDGQVLSHQIATIGNSNYYFDYSGKMLNDEAWSLWDDGISYDLRAHAGGSLYCGEWYLDEWDRYTYYGYDCKRVEDGFVELGNSLFYFRNGYAAQNEMFETEDGIYVAASDCAVTRQYDGWLNFKNRFYYVSGNQLVRNCIMEIGGSKYAFNSEGCMYEDGIYWINDSEYDNSCYLITDSGAIVTEQGWKQYYGGWYYVTEDGRLYKGILELNGATYYLAPALGYSTLDYLRDGENYYLYLVMPDGLYQKVTSDGYYNTPYGRVLVENGVLVEGWKSIGGSWYYFMPVMCAGNWYEFDDGAYYFDNTGVMQANSWIPYYSTYLYADEYGRLADGVVSIADKEYLFAGYELEYNSFANYNGTYVSDRNALATKIEDNGWTLANGYWYYTVDGNVRTGSVLIDGEYYYFDYSSGHMLSDYYDGNIYFDEYGRRYTGWKQINGSWYYFAPYKQYGFTTIDGNDYYFDNVGKMLSNTTYCSGNEIYVIDAYGIIVDSYNVPDGIVYQNGSAYMYKDGMSYNGWYGDYYFHYGEMMIDRVITDKGNHYYLDNHGKYIYNGWYQRYNDWLYADAYGALCYDEWLQLGDAWYYFSGYEMVSDGIYYISDEDAYAKFDEYGRFIGYVDGYGDEELPTGTANSWANINGKWYYYNSTGTMVTDKTLYLNGYWYAFDYEGAMVADRLYTPEYHENSFYYYTSSGARLEAPNQWKLIDGNWYYFGADSSVVLGWINISGTSYYINLNYEYDENTDEENWYCEMYTGYHLINDKVYYFNAGGDLWGEYVGNGWLQLDDGSFVYFKDGELLKNGIYNINGTDYYFTYDGTLLTNGHSYINGTYVYASESGALYGAGWHLTDEGWIYIDAAGNLSMNGVYQIGYGVYFFDGCYMV